MVISFKTTPGAILAVQRQTFKIVCFRDAISGRLKVDMDATTGGKQNPALQGSRVILIYKTYMHTEPTLDPERCAFKSDAGMRNKWIIKQIQQVVQHGDCASPPHQTEINEDMEEDVHPVAEHGQVQQDMRKAADGAADGAVSGAGQQTETMHDYIIRVAKMPIRQVQRDELDTLPIFNIPIRANNGPPAVGTTTTESRNTYAPLAPLGSETEGRDDERPSFN